MTKTERLDMTIKLLMGALESLERYENVENQVGYTPRTGWEVPNIDSKTAILRTLTEARAQLMRLKNEMEGR